MLLNDCHEQQYHHLVSCQYQRTCPLVAMQGHEEQIKNGQTCVHSSIWNHPGRNVFSFLQRMFHEMTSTLKSLLTIKFCVPVGSPDTSLIERQPEAKEID